MNAIELVNVSLDYPLDIEDLYSFKNAVLNFYTKAKIPVQKSFRALDNISLQISHGEKVAIIGLNGSGKTTLLRTISQIYMPTRGRVVIDGNICPLLDFATGFDLYLTGIESIKIRLMFLGLSKKEAEKMVPQIVEFSELGEVINQPIKTYSAGMVMRLAFATSTAIRPEILVADEVIGTGDIKFAAKAKERMESFLSGECTTVLSSHSMDLVRTFCSRAIWLHKGRIVADGSVEEVILDYERDCNN